MNSNQGAALFAQTMAGLARANVPFVPTYGQLANVNADFSITLETTRQSFPVGAYFLIDYLFGVLNPMTTTLSDGTGSGGSPGHSHSIPALNVTRPTTFLPLVPGDRVLVVVVMNGVVPVVVGRVRPSLPVVVP